MSADQPENMRWVDDETLDFDGTRFLVTIDSSLYSTRSTRDRFLLLKTKEQLTEYVRVARELRPERIFELGVMQGGSTVFYEKLFRPIKMVAIEWSPPLAVLNDYILENGLQERVRPFFNVDQADRERLIEILDAEFAQEQLDLVVDDASHMLRQTTESFNVLFPRVRPGGVYIIEDWGWEHWPGVWQTEASPFHGTEALTNLVFEIVMTAASDRRIVAGVSISNNMVQVRRGPQALGSDFAISSSYLVHDRAKFALAIARSVNRAQRRLPALSRMLESVARRFGPSSKKG